jgi:hypothetical protein
MKNTHQIFPAVRISPLLAGAAVFVMLFGGPESRLIGAAAPMAISINFSGSNTTAMASSETAGVVPKANWNNATGAVSTSALPLLSEGGSPSGASVSWTSDNNWSLPISDVAGNYRAMRGYLDNVSGNATTVTFSGIVSGTYNVYVYTDGDNTANQRTASYQLSGTGLKTTKINATDMANTNFSGAFVQANNSAGNYVLFSGVAISSGFKLTATPGTADWPRAPVNAIQIIPSTSTATTPVAVNINFMGLNTTAMGSAETAGVVPAANWNNVPATATGTGFGLVNNQGLATGSSVSWHSDNTWYIPISDTAGSGRMMHGYLDNVGGNPSTVSFSGIVPGTYDVYVYTDGDNGGSTRTGAYQISGPSVATTSSVSATDPANANFNGTFIRANNSAGNYVLFNSVAITSGFTLTATPGATTDVGRAPVNAIQIIPSSQTAPPPVSVAVSITPTSATLLAAKSQQFTATVSGTQNTAVTWSVNPAVGTISSTGLYTAPSTLTSNQTVTVTATSAADATKSASASVLLDPPAAAPLTITTASLPAGSVSLAYSATLAVTGGTAPYNWTVTSGALPQGLNLTASTGLISGTSSQTGSYSFGIGVTDSLGNQATQGYSISMTATAPSYYVSSVNGNDAWSGKLASPNSANSDGPFLTLARAQQAMQTTSLKTTYLRGGTYHPAASSGIGCLWGGSAAINLIAADSGETWSYYPPDGYNSAILDGGAPAVTQSGTPPTTNPGLGCAFAADQALSVTITGLQFQNWNYGALMVNTNGTAPAVVATFTNNIVHDIQVARVGAAGVDLSCPGSGTTASNNYFYNIAGPGAEIQSSGATCTISNVTIANNFILNSCTWAVNGGDCGAIYTEAMTPSSSNIQITNNYIRDVNVVSNGHGAYGPCCAVGVYEDQGSPGATYGTIVTGNVVSGVKSTCFMVNTNGSHNSFTGNLCDLNTPAQGVQIIWDDESTAGSNTFQHNIIVAGSEAGSIYSEGYANVGSSDVIANNAYWNYGGTSMYYNGSSFGDSSPVYENAQLSCWPVTVPGGSPVFNSPVSFPGITGHWGPPGFVIPQTGTAPSWPHGC